MIHKPAIGLLLTCLIPSLLAGCSTARKPPPEPKVVTLTEIREKPDLEPELRRCLPPEVKLRVNGDLLDDRNLYARALDQCDSQVRGYLEWRAKKAPNSVGKTPENPQFSVGHNGGLKNP